MSNTTGPKFYKIDFEREVVLQGKTSSFITINRNDDILSPDEILYVVFYPNTRTFENVGAFEISQTSELAGQCDLTSQGIIEKDLSKTNVLSFNSISKGLYVKNTQDFVSDNSGPITIDNVEYINTQSGICTKITLKGATGFDIPFVGETGSTGTKPINVGFYSDVDVNNWKFNTVPLKDLEKLVYNVPGTGNAVDYTNYQNPFDGSVYSPTGSTGTGFTGTGFVSRDLLGFSSSNINASPSQTENRGLTFRIDYEGNDDGHLKLNMLIFRYDPLNPSFGPISQAMPLLIPESIMGPNNPSSFSTEFFGFKSGDTSSLPIAFSDNIDYQELHIFGYTETSVRTSRKDYQNLFSSKKPIFDDRSSYAVLKTNPKLTGNVKLTIDSSQRLFLNSFDANSLLSDSKYKRFVLSPESQYQRDLYEFFKNTPNELIYELFQADNQYQNTKREYYEQFDNFYSYGVEQLASKFYDEDFSFLAPIWLRKIIPDYFVIFRVDHPFSQVSYEAVNNNSLFKEVFSNARIIKTFDMRESSNLGKYIRKIVNDPRFIERPLEVSFDKDTPTIWNGISYKDGTITGKGELLEDFWKQDRAIKDFESFITGGFERNGIISSNLINLEFLFDDEEAIDYSINRYIGLYVSEIQLAEMELASSTLGKIPNQSPPPKPGVDGEPYSTREFIQKNPDGIILPIEYYHNTTFDNNTSAVPFYQGNVVGKLPLPLMVDDPLRFFYIRDKNDSFKRVIRLSEVDYGFTGTTDYKRVTELKLFDTQENISNYGGPVQIISQDDAVLLNQGKSQLVINLFNQDNDKIIADNEILELSVKSYSSSNENSEYFFQVSSAGGTATTFTYFQNQSICEVTNDFTQPLMGGSVTVDVSSTQDFVKDEVIYIVLGGFYKILSVNSPSNVTLRNLGNPENSLPGSTVYTNSLVGSFPTGVMTYNYTSLNYKLNIDNKVSLDLTSGYVGSSSNYNLLDSYKLVINSPSHNLNEINSTTPIDVDIKNNYQQYRWRMIANSTGLQKGKSWSFPVQDPNNYDWISNFSNEGSISDVAKAISSCINSFLNSPVESIAIDGKIILKSNLTSINGNSIEFSRYMVDGKSKIYNLGFYEDGNVNVKNSIKVINFDYTSSGDIKVDLIRPSSTFGEIYYYVKILKKINGSNVIVRANVNPTDVNTANSTGTYNSFYLTSNILNDDYFVNDENLIPFTINFENLVVSDTYQDFIILVKNGSLVTQRFVGGVQRNRSRSKVSLLDGQRYYENKKITVPTKITAYSNILHVQDIRGISIGFPVEGFGIPSNSKVIDIDKTNNTVRINSNSTETGNYDLSFGNLSILNDNKSLQNWFQTAKSQFSRLMPWNIQGKYVYSLPYLEEGVYDNSNKLSSFLNYDQFSIIQLENNNEEFYISDLKKIISYEMYRPIMGLFSIFPIKNFDYDFFYSEYSYSPVIETFRYFFNETIEKNNFLELPSDENYVLIPQKIDLTDVNQTRLIGSTGTFSFSFEGYNEKTKNWDELTQVTVTTTSQDKGFIINTYTPFYNYDINEHPQKWDDDEYYLIRGSGYRNFQRSLITQKTNDDLEKVDVKKFRIKYLGGNHGSEILTHLNIKKSDYSTDSDIREFGGFLGLSDILNQNDQQKISILKNDGNYVEAFLKQQLKSEYDRLRENYTKEFSTLSRVVPYILKWVQEGTDARDNYYRLNNSRAFGITNLSPDNSVDFAEPIILSHEFPYLDTLPKDYPEDSIIGSRSYMFSKLSDIVINEKSWYDLLTSDISQDWFLKYFSVGYPTELDYYKNNILKPREERYTFMNFNRGLSKVQTLFRGVKIQMLDIDDTKSELPEILPSEKYNDYKFSAIQRTIPYSFYKKESPIEIEIVKNDKFKSVLIIITRRTYDYRIQSGLNDYMFSYSAIDNLKNNNQQQYTFSNFVSDLNVSKPYVATSSSYTDQATLRPRQLFMGGGYLQHNDSKLSGIIDTKENLPSYSISAKYLNIFLKSSNDNYPFIVSDEVNPYVNNYQNNPSIYNTSAIEVRPQNFTKEGFLNKFLSVGINDAIDGYYLYDLTDTRIKTESITLDMLGFSSPSRYSYFRNISSSSIINEGLYTYTYPSNIYPFETVETFNISGGVEFYQNTKNLLSFANISKNINTDNGIVKYYEILSSGKKETKSFKLRIISGDQIIKTGVLNYTIDQDKPPQYENLEVIGYDIVNTNQNEIVIRHRGYYEPKSLDVISFWVREDEGVTRHYEEDFILSNTRICSESLSAGIIRNYGINKVAKEEILKISQGTAFKSEYELIHEIAIDKKDVNVLHSSWDSGYFRLYTDLNIYQNINGYLEMKEFKSFLGSKTMTVPKTLDIHTFTSSEVSFNLITPPVTNGLVSTTDLSKPILEINLQLEERVIRFIKEGMNSENSIDEFSDMNNSLNLGLTDSEIISLKENYIRKNILQLYEVSEIILYSMQNDSIPLFTINLSESEKLSAGYRIDKNCQTTKISKFNYTIKKTLDTTKSYGYSVGVIIKRV